MVVSNLVTAPKQRNTQEEQDDIKAGRIPTAWKDEPSKAAGRRQDAILSISPYLPFGYRNHISINREHGLIRSWLATGGRL